MARAVFRLSDFVLSLFLLFVGLNLCLPSGDFHIAEFAAGIGFASLGVLVFVFSLSSRLSPDDLQQTPEKEVVPARHSSHSGSFAPQYAGCSVPVPKNLSVDECYRDFTAVCWIRRERYWPDPLCFKRLALCFPINSAVSKKSGAAWIK